MISYLANILNQPYLGTCGFKDNLKQLFFISVFVTLFLWFFEPFNFSQYQGNKILLATNFGLVTFLVSLTYDLVSTYLFKIDQSLPSWKFWKWLIHTSVLVLFIGLGNYYMIASIYDSIDFDISVLTSVIVSTFAIGIFPIFFGGMLSLTKNANEFQKQADGIDTSHKESFDNNEQLNIPSVSGSALSINSSNILYLEAMENYVAIHYVSSEAVKKELIRNTLKTLESHLAAPNFLRCHRSYLVNLDKVLDVKGNSQGLTLHLRGLSENSYVPVSRKYISKLKSGLSI